MTRTVTRSNSKVAQGIVRYDALISVKTTKRVRDRLIEKANKADRTLPEYLRTVLEHHAAEDGPAQSTR